MGLEIAQMMQEVTSLTREHGASGCVALGDFNALPRSYSYLFFLHAWHASDDSLALNPQSAFALVEYDEEYCTSFTYARKMWIDYIFFSSSALQRIDSQVEKCPA